MGILKTNYKPTTYMYMYEMFFLLEAKGTCLDMSVDIHVYTCTCIRVCTFMFAFSYFVDILYLKKHCMSVSSSCMHWDCYMFVYE